MITVGFSDSVEYPVRVEVTGPNSYARASIDLRIESARALAYALLKIARSMEANKESAQ